MEKYYFNFGKGVLDMPVSKIDALNMRNGKNGGACLHIGKPTSKVAPVMVTIMLWLFAFFAMPIANAQFSGGTGTEDNPYIISTPAELAQLATYVNNGNTSYNNKYYKLDNHIDLSDYQSGEGWTPIGLNISFTGVFDGNGKKITNLKIEGGIAPAGLFGTIADGVVKNLGVENVNINVSCSLSMVGGVVGYNFRGTVLNCYSTGSIISASSAANYSGGVVGSINRQNNNGSVSYCYSTCSVSASSTSTFPSDICSAGGVVGNNSYGLVTNCYSTGSISASGSSNSYSGGIVGWNGGNTNFYGIVSSCVALNPSIICSGGTSNFGRVLGLNNSGSSYALIDNLGFNAMLNPSGNTTWNNIGYFSKDGANIDVSEIYLDGTLDGRFTSENGWTTQNGKLPGLFGNVVDMPDHLPPSFPVITTTNLPNGVVYNEYNHTLSANGDTPITWSLDNDTELPNGLLLSTNGVISGISNVSGTFSFIVKATNAVGSDTKELDITIDKASQTPPETPTLLSKTTTSITLNEMENCEYQMNSGSWQTNTTFDGLTLNTSYSFVARKMETETYFASPESMPVTFTTLESTLLGFVSISGNAVFGETLTANTEELSSFPIISDLGTISYLWKRGETVIGTISTYNLVEADINNTITVTVTASNCDGSVTSNQAGPVTKASQTPPAAPTLLTKSVSSVTLNEIEGCEFSMNDGDWQLSAYFSELTPNTPYWFVARMFETNTHFASEASPSVTFTTDKATLSGTVTLSGSAVFGATISANIGLVSEPSIADLGTFTYLWKRGESVIIGAENSTYTLVEADINNTITLTVSAANCNGSVTSNQAGPVTKASQTPPTAPTLLTKTENSITLNEIEGCEFSMNDGYWQLSAYFNELTPNTPYWFVARKSVTNTHFASEPSPTTEIYTNPQVGISDTKFGNLIIYSHQKNIHIKNESNKPLNSVEIYDMTGRLVYKNGIKKIETVITLSAATGIYAVKVIWEDGKTEVRKLRIES